ncbi:MAG: TonB-dependent receptor [Bacteroidetes bacterium]|nr:TonB-dependent receptor [Bacteroidota bacterium]
MKFKLSVFIFLLINSISFSQDSLQIIKGRIMNADNHLPVHKAIIYIDGIYDYFFYSDSSGYYEGKITPGTYSIMVQLSGFKSQLRNNIVVLTGKQQVQDFELKEYNVQLDSVQVISNSIKENVSLDLWNVERFAAAFYDPARAASSHSGMVNTDDQANNISIHGTSPNYLQWKVEGIEVVNPNHLENAGTINDRPSLNGGGVSLFSAQLLQNSGILFSPFEPSSGNALSGIFDMKLRNGNAEKYERTVQASLLGLDFSIEGPFSKKSRASFLVNYRYSTIGILSLLGVDFGGEKTSFQDLSFVITLPYDRGQLKLFSITGASETTFRGPVDSTKIETQKDLQNIDYYSTTTINGINFLHSFSNSLFIKSIIAYSGKNVNRISQSSGVSEIKYAKEKDGYRQEKFSGMTFLSKRIGNSFKIKGGSSYNYFTSRLHTSVNDQIYSEDRIDEILLQPFISFEGTLKKIEFKAGLHSMYQNSTGDFTLQPRIISQYLFSPKQDLTLSYGRSAQLQPFFLCLGNPLNRNLKPTIVNSFSLTHHVKALTLDFKSEFYYHLFERIPVNKLNGFSAFNYFNEQVLFELESAGKATVYGYDLTIEKTLNSFYLIVSGSFFNSVYTNNTEYFKSRYSTNYNFALTAGKEIRLKNKKKTIGTDIRGFMRDGFKESDITKPNSTYVYDSQLPSYYRIDFRISYKKNKTKSSVIWALDIQNLTNQKNISYHYYDMVTGKIEPREQLGLIPVISYKLFF